MAIKTMWQASPFVRHIQWQSQHRSRFEIDSQLLEEGYAPEQIEAIWQLLNPTTHEAVEGAWRVLGGGVLPKFWTRRLPKNLRWQYFGFLVAAVIAAFLPSLLLSLWPLIYYSVAIGGLGIALNTGAFIFLFWQNRVRRREGYGRDYSLITAGMVSSMAIFAYLLTCIFAAPVGPSNIADLSVDNHDYHLVYSSICIDSCSETVYLYRCDFFNLICSDYTNLHKTLSYSDDDGRYNPGFGPGDSLIAAYDPATNKINLLNEGQIIYAFDP